MTFFSLLEQLETVFDHVFYCATFEVESIHYHEVNAVDLIFVCVKWVHLVKLGLFE